MSAEVKKLNGAYEDPDRFLIFGLDVFPSGINPAEFTQFEDPRRIKMPVKEFLIESILQHGVNDPITCVSAKASSGDRYRIVVNGRQRVRAAREANKRLKKAKSDHFVLVPYVTVGTADMRTVAISNEGHTRQTPLDRAEKASRMLKWGSTKAQVRASFEADDGTAISDQTLDNYLSLLRLTDKQKEDLESGKLGLTKAYQLARQGKKGKANGKASQAEDEPEDSDGSGLKRPKLKAVAALADLYAPTEDEPSEGDDAIIHAVLIWVTTGDASLLPRDAQKHVAKVVSASYRAAREEM